MTFSDFLTHYIMVVSSWLLAILIGFFIAIAFYYLKNKKEVVK